MPAAGGPGQAPFNNPRLQATVSNEPTFRRLGHAIHIVGWFKNAGYRRFSDDNSASTAVRGNVRPPHDYGIAVILLGVADRLVPSDPVEALRDVVSRFLRASYVDRMDQLHAEQEFAALRRLLR